MNERQLLIIVHAVLFVLQIGVAVAAIAIAPGFAAINATIGVAQAFFPNPWKVQP